MTNAWSGPPDRAGWYAQQNPSGETADPDLQQQAARNEWAETHPTVFRRLLARFRRS